MTGERPIPNEPDTPRATSRAPTNGRIPPHDLATEEALLGVALYRREGPAAVASISPEAFYGKGHAHIAAAILDLHRSGRPVDPHTVAHRLDQAGALDLAGGPNRLIELQSRAPAGIAPERYAELVAERAEARRLLGTLAEAVDDAYHCRIDQVYTRLEAARNGHRPPTRGLTPTLEEFLAGDDDHYDWAIPDVLEATDRVLITGPEGGGKSTLIRQVAVQAAAGIHPFTLDPVDPLRVLLLDLENSRRHVRRQLRPLHIAADHRAAGTLHIETIPEGLNLLDPADAQLLEQIIEGVQPQLVAGGPVYKLVGGDPTEEAPARAAAALLDRLRTRHGFALMLETHQPHESGGGRRAERPYGASLWKRWPEFGLHLAANGELRHWRGARDERSWPAALKRGGAWPWTPETNQRAVTFMRIIDAVRDAGQKLSVRELAAQLDADRNQIQRAIDANRTQFDTVCKEVAG